MTTTQHTNLRILRLEAENIKKLTVVEINPDGNLIQITGPNESGKTSVLDSIWWAMTGAKHIQTTPIREGETEGRIRLELGRDGEVELVVSKLFKGENQRLAVMTADGARYPRPQTILDDLIGALSFDPLAFMKAEAKVQRAQLARLLGLDFTEIDRAIKALRETRRDINRDAGALTARAEAIVLPEDADIPTEVFDVEAFQTEWEAAAGKNNAAASWTDTEERLGLEITEIVGLVQRAEQDLATARKAEDIARGVLAKHHNTEQPLTVDMAELREKGQTGRAGNALFEEAKKKTDLTAEAATKTEASKQETAKIEAHEAQKATMIAEADMPLEGLAFDEENVLFDGLPLDQASDAKQLLISTAIASRMSPALRVIRIRDGSLLDSTSLKALAKFADDENLQIWIERVDETGAVGIVMEDGHVAGGAGGTFKEVGAEEPTAQQADLLALDDPER